MANGKLAKYQQKNKTLRSENRELAETIEEMNGNHNPSTLRQFVAVGIKLGSAYGISRLFVLAQQRGWMPQKIPVDFIAGVGGQLATSPFHGPVAAVFRDISDGAAEGALGRMAAYHQLEKSELEGRPALLLPAPAAPAP